MFRPRFNPFKAMRGGVATQTATNYGTIAVFNDSVIGELLIIWGIAFDTGTADSASGVTNSSIGGSAGDFGTFITGEAVQPGLITYDDHASVLPADLQWSYGNNFAALSTEKYPLAIIRAGWSFFMQASSMGDTIAGSIIWQAAHMEDISGRPCPICDVIIQLPS